MRRLLLVVLAAGFALTACNLDPRTATLPGGVATGGDGYTVTATFASADNLVPNSEVQYQNVRIGTVTAISLNHQTWQATVKLRLLKSTALPADAEASIGQKSLLGAEFVQVSTPTRSTTNTLLSDDPVIPLSRTGEYPETEDVLSAVSLLLNDGGLAQLKTITTEVNKTLGGRTGTARDLLVQLNTFVGSLNEQKQQLIEATEALNRLAGELADNRQTVANALTHITPAVTTLNREKTKLTSALAAMDHLGVVATSVIAASRNGLETNLALLRPTLTKLAEAGSNLPDSLPLFVSFPFPITTLFKAVKGDYMNLFETLDLSVSSIKRDFLQQIPVVGSSNDDTVRQAKNPLTAPLGPSAPKTGTSTAPSPPKTGSPSPTRSPTPKHSTTPSSSPSSCSIVGSVFGDLLMLTATVRTRLVIFAVVSVVALTVISVVYIHLPQLLGFDQYRVTADFADTSGLYSHAIVTYRGAQVGKVGAITLRPDGVTVQLDLDGGTHIPADSTATIHSTSAIGEQYVDLVPKTATGPDLHDGSKIPRSATAGLPSTSALLDSIDALVRSLPKVALGRSLDDLAVSFGNSGPDLQRMLDSASLLLQSASANITPTRSLINNFVPFLGTQQDIGAQTTTTVTNLASFTHQLVLSNDDIVALLRTTPALTQQVTGLESDLTPTLNVLLANLRSTGQVLDVYVPALKQLLTIYPALVADLIAFAQPTASTGYIPLYFHLNVDDPPECIQGFLPPNERRDPSQTAPMNTPSGLYCKVAKSDPRSVRGARNLPCLNNPGARAATPASCLGLKEPTPSPTTTPTSSAFYEPSTGQIFTPSGASYLIGDVAGQGKEITTWQELLLRPIGK